MRVDPHHRVELLLLLALAWLPDGTGHGIALAQPVLSHHRQREVDVVAAGQVAARPDEGVAVEDVEDSGDRQQHVVLGDLQLVLEAVATVSRAALVAEAVPPPTAAAAPAPALVVEVVPGAVGRGALLPALRAVVLLAAVLLAVSPVALPRLTVTASTAAVGVGALAGAGLTRTCVGALGRRRARRCRLGCRRPVRVGGHRSVGQRLAPGGGSHGALTVRAGAGRRSDLPLARAAPPEPLEPPTWRASIAATRSALRMPEAPAMPSWPASDLSSGSSIADSPDPPVRFFCTLCVLSLLATSWVASVTE